MTIKNDRPRILALGRVRKNVGEVKFIEDLNAKEKKLIERVQLQLRLEHRSRLTSVVLSVATWRNISLNYRKTRIV